MKINRVKNTKRNIVWGVFEKIVSLFLPFLLRTMLIKTLGEQFLGLNSLFSSLLQVLNMVELGFSSAIVFNMYKPIAENDKKTICILMNAYKKIYRVIGIFVFVIGVSLLPFLSILIKGDIPDGYNLYLLYIIYLTNTVVSYFLFAYKNCLLNAHHRNDIVSKVHTFVLILQYLYQFTVLLIFKNYYLYIIILPIISILNNIINALIVKKMYPQYICYGTLTPELKSKIKYNVTGLAIGKVCVVSRNSLDSIYLSAFIGLTTVAIYGNYYYIFTAINTFLSIIINAMTAGIGNSIAVETEEKNYKNFRLFNYLYLVISGWCTVCLLCLYQPFMELWMGKKLMFEMSTVVLFCIYFYSLKLGDIRSMYSNAAGLFWESKNYVIVETIANAILNFLFVRTWGINGIIVATNITIIFVNFIWGTRILYKNYFRSYDFIRFIIEDLIYTFVTIIICFITYFACNILQLSCFKQLLFNGIICLVVPTFLYYMTYRKTKLYEDSLQFAKKLINKK